MIIKQFLDCSLKNVVRFYVHHEMSKRDARD